MTIRIFNPDHDLALAANRERFTAPHAGRQIRSELGFIPALWSDDGDIVIVEDIDYSESAYRRLKYNRKPQVEFATFMQIADILSHTVERSSDGNIIGSSLPKIDVWGWNKSILFQLKQSGLPLEGLPSMADLDIIRDLSGRQHTSLLLKQLRSGIEDVTCGESVFCTSIDEVDSIGLKSYVVKAPWSSSGRGVRYVLDGDEPCHIRNTRNWLCNTIAQQGGVMVEPLYNKVKDFALEFYADGKGNIEYSGLSLFSTVNGAYTGNILATEEEKRMTLSKYISLDLLDMIIDRLCSNVKTAPYCGPFGVDMMVVANSDSGFLLHPCVEINLRRTMGHVALALSPTAPDEQGVMNIAYSEKEYHFIIKKNIITN